MRDWSAKSSALKWKGSGLRGVKRQNLIEVVIAWFGVFITMLALIKMDDTLMDKSGDPWTYDPSWWSSTLCIVFALTSAPVGQPFQIVMSHLWCALIGLACQHIPDSDIEDFFDYHRESREDREGMVLPQSWKQAIAVASAIAGSKCMSCVMLIKCLNTCTHLTFAKSFYSGIHGYHAPPFFWACL